MPDGLTSHQRRISWKRSHRVWRDAALTASHAAVIKTRLIAASNAASWRSRRECYQLIQRVWLQWCRTASRGACDVNISKQQNYNKMILSTIKSLCHSAVEQYRLFISERELTFTFAICYRPSVCRLSFVCNVRAPYLAGWNFRQFVFAIWYLGHPLTFNENFTEIVPGEPLRRGFKRKRGSEI